MDLVITKLDKDKYMLLNNKQHWLRKMKALLEDSIILMHKNIVWCT